MTNSHIEVRASYSDLSSMEQMDKSVYAAAGRVSDFSGGGITGRDHGWVCRSEIEAHKIQTALRKLGLAVEVRNDK